MKKLCTLLLLLSGQTALASHSWNGFYQTAGFGGTLAQFNMQQDLIGFIPNAAGFELPFEQNLEDLNFAGMIGAGYSHRMTNEFVLGLMITAGITNATVVQQNILGVPVNPSGSAIALQGLLRSTLKNDFALLFKPGYLIGKRTMIYGLIGPRLGYFETSINSNFAFIGTIEASARDTDSGYQLGISSGLGIERMLNKHTSLALEYQYSYYGHIHSPNAYESIFVGGPTNGFLSDKTEVKAASNTVLMNLSYHF